MVALFISLSVASGSNTCFCGSYFATAHFFPPFGLKSFLLPPF